MMRSLRKAVEQVCEWSRARPIQTSLLEGLGAGAFMLASSLLCIAIVYQQAADAHKTAVHENLLRLAQAAATVVDVDLHDTLRLPSQQDSPEFARVVDPLRRMLNACAGVKYIYTAILVDDQIHFIADSAFPGDSDGDGRDDQAKIMEIYEDPDEEMYGVLRNGVATTTQEPYTDEWGTFLTGYAPFQDAQGRIRGIVGVDITAESFMQRLGAIRWAAELACIPAIVVSIITGAGVFIKSRTTRRSIGRLAQTRDSLEHQTLALESAKQQLDNQNKSLQGYIDEIVEVNRVLEERESLLAAQNNKLSALNGELVSQKQELETAWIEAKAATKAKSEFLANMSHEIRTPMTAIIGYTEMLVEKATDAEVRNMVSTIQRNGHHLLEIINDLLDLSKIEAGGAMIETQACNPVEIARDVVELMQVRADAKGIAIGFKTDGHIPTAIKTDPTRLKQILINLVGNAIKFSSKGEVRLSVKSIAEKGRKRLQFDVIDNGIGLSPEQADRLFTPFSQADTSVTRKYGGTGLGLTVSRRLAQLLGGNVILVGSIPGVETRFRVTIEAGLTDDMNAPPQGSIDRTSTPASVSAAKHAPDCLMGCRVLLAEDGLDNQRLVDHILRKAGANVVIVENGQLACDTAMRELHAGTPFDAIVLDMQMPVLDGYEASGRLRKEGYTGPIIALTAHAMSSDRIKCIDAGCTDYATKPINRNTLINVLHKWVNCPSGSTDKNHNDSTDIETGCESNSLPGGTDGLGDFVSRVSDAVARLQPSIEKMDLDSIRKLVDRVRTSAGDLELKSIFEAANRLNDSLDAIEPAESIGRQVRELIKLCEDANVEKRVRPAAR